MEQVRLRFLISSCFGKLLQPRSSAQVQVVPMISTRVSVPPQTAAGARPHVQDTIPREEGAGERLPRVLSDACISRITG